MEASKNILYEEEFFLNSTGMKLFTCRWLPPVQQTKALLFLCHGYGVECSIFMKETGVRLAEEGYGVFGIDYQGHGKSEGKRCYISNFDHLVHDYLDFFRSITAKEQYKSKARFLLGESMGGAMALRVHRMEPQEWNGAVLLAPMCKISEKLKPPPFATLVLTKLSSIIPTWKIVPSKDVIESAFKDPLKRQKIRENPYVYQDKPRVKTALELFHVSLDLETRLDEVTLPFLVLHGEDDKVTDPQISRDLYEEAGSFDKTLKVFPGMWHGLTTGEPDDNIEIVFTEIIAWLNKRSNAGYLRSSPVRNSYLKVVKKEADPSDYEKVL